MARNRYGWEKRAKEMARKQKSEEKMKRRQGKPPGAQPDEKSAAGDDPGSPSAPEWGGAASSGVNSD